MSAALKLQPPLPESGQLSQKPPLGEKRPKPRLVWENPRLSDGCVREKSKLKARASYGRVLYNYHRYYEAETSRYVTSDPIGLNGGINTYIYALANPTKFIDPKGEAVWVCSRPADGLPGNHSYFWDDRGKGRSCGRMDSSGHKPGQGSGPSGDGEAGPPIDACRKIPGSDGREDDIMDCCEKNSNNYPWFPGVTDCQNGVENCLSDKGLPHPGVPGGRFTYPCENGTGKCPSKCPRRGCNR